MAQIFKSLFREKQVLASSLTTTQAKRSVTSILLSFLCTLLWLALFIHHIRSDTPDLVYVLTMGCFCLFGTVMLNRFAREILMELEWKCLAIGMPIFFFIALLVGVESAREVFSFLLYLLIR